MERLRLLCDDARTRSTRRIVLLTLAATLAVLVVLVAGVGGAIGYRRERDRRMDEHAQRLKVEREMNALRARARTAWEQGRQDASEPA
jgi:hypothetical protein